MSIKTALIGPTRVPAISLGTWSWGDKTWGYKPEDLPQIREAWFACLEAGYPFFDTAEVSGLRAHIPSSGGTDKVELWPGLSTALFRSTVGSIQGQSSVYERSLKLVFRSLWFFSLCQGWERAKRSSACYSKRPQRRNAKRSSSLPSVSIELLPASSSSTVPTTGRTADDHMIRRSLQGCPCRTR